MLEIENVMTFPNPFRFVRAMFRTVSARLKGYEILADEQTQVYRERICERCPYLDGEQCGACGCLLYAKTVLNLEECPKSFWPRVLRKRKKTKLSSPG